MGRTLKFSKQKGTKSAPATSQPSGSSCARPSTGSKRARPAKPTVVRAALQSAADLAATRTAAENRAALAAARRARAEKRAETIGLTTPVASRQGSSSSVVMSSGGSGPVMSSGGSGPLAKRQAPARASKSSTFEGMDELDPAPDGPLVGALGEMLAATPTTDETSRTKPFTAGAAGQLDDSSDEEGAHKPPPPPPEPALPPAPLLPQPGPQLAQQIARLATALPPAPPPRSASTQQPRTTRVTADLKPKGHKQSFASAEERTDLKAKSQQQRRKREQAHRAMFATVSRMLDSPDVSVDDVLMIEFAVQPENQADPGAMRAAYLKLLHVGWSLVSMRGRFQVDGNACGIWIQVARDLFIEYVDSHEFGTCTFEAFLHRRLKEQGVLPTERLSGLTLKAAMQTNQKFILEQRADMRGRLVQAAIAGKLAFSEAQLGGFAQELASRKPVEELDDIFEFDIGPPKA